MKTKSKKIAEPKNSLQESLRRFGHMLAVREERGDESKDYQIRKDNHQKMLDRFYNR